jgi:hypothetical protein
MPQILPPPLPLPSFFFPHDCKAKEEEKESTEAMMSRLQGMAKLRASYHPNNSMGSKKVIRDSDLSVVIDPLRW